MNYFFAESCVFAKQSPGPLHCGWPYDQRSFSLSYRANLPSSLAVIHSSAFGYSPRLPVSVYGTSGTNISLETFLGSRLHRIIHASEDLWYFRCSAPSTHLTIKGIPTYFNELFRQLAATLFLRPPFSLCTGTGILTRLPLRFPFGCTLRSRLTPIRLTLIGKP